MELLQLEHFLAVVEEGTFTRAAERVGRTQPAVSQSIKKLEEEIGAPLFARGSNDVALTDAGRLLAEHARRMVAVRDDAVRQLVELKTLAMGTLTVAAHESAAVYLLSSPLRHYLQRFPQIKIGIYRSRLSEIPRQVMDREVDLGFVKDEPAFHELRWTEVHTDTMVLIASPTHPLAARTAIGVEDLSDQPFVLHHLCVSTAELLQRTFARHRARLRVVAELWSFENLKSFVRENIGLALVPGVTVRDELRDGLLVRIAVPELETPRRTLIVHRDEDYLSDSASELIKLVSMFQWEPLSGQARIRPRLVSGGRRLRAQRRS